MREEEVLNRLFFTHEDAIAKARESSRLRRIRQCVVLACDFVSNTSTYAPTKAIKQHQAWLPKTSPWKTHRFKSKIARLRLRRLRL
jgi:hypothetical protein